MSYETDPIKVMEASLEKMDSTSGSKHNRAKETFLLAYIAWLAKLRSRNIEVFYKKDCEARNDVMCSSMYLTFSIGFLVKVLVELFS